MHQCKECGLKDEYCTEDYCPRCDVNDIRQWTEESIRYDADGKETTSC